MVDRYIELSQRHHQWLFNFIFINKLCIVFLMLFIQYKNKYFNCQAISAKLILKKMLIM